MKQLGWPFLKKIIQDNSQNKFFLSTICTLLKYQCKKKKNIRLFTNVLHTTLQRFSLFYLPFIFYLCTVRVRQSVCKTWGSENNLYLWNVNLMVDFDPSWIPLMDVCRRRNLILDETWGVYEGLKILGGVVTWWA